MTDEQVTQLSALVDGELTSRHAVPLYDSVECDPVLRATWERYHLIGQALRGERVQPQVRGLAAAVREQLNSEPAPVRPRAASVQPRVWHSPFAGAALAAAAAFVAVFAVPSLFQGPTPAPIPTAALAVAPPPAIGAPANPAVRRWQTDRDDLASKLDLFLVNHQEAAPASGVKGMLSYATLVGYEARH
jgi:sigma-E factor negative regulatory protein RseA